MKINRVKLYGMLLLLTGVPSTFVFGATDITGHWAEKTIIEWQNKGKINGYEDDTFHPDASITRAEFVHLLNSVISLENSVAIHFDDVTEKDWFYQDVVKAAGSHIIAGFEDNTFRPNEKITRAQAALIIKNVLQLPDDTVSVFITDDAEIPDWAKLAVYMMLHTGYLSGYEDGSFAPNKSMTRAEAISMLNRIEKNTNEALLNVNQNTNELIQNTIQNVNETTQNEISENIENHPQNIIWKNGDNGNAYHNDKSKEEKKPEKKSEITITKENIADFYAKTLEDDVILVVDSDGMELLDMELNGKVEIVYTKTPPAEQKNVIPTIFLKGSTKIKDMTISTPVIIKSENNSIENLTLKDSVTIRDTKVIHINCLYDKEIVEKKKICISLDGNTNCNIAISESAAIETICLSEQAQAHIINQGKIKEVISFSQYSGTSIINNGVIDSLIALKPESITAENVVIEPAMLQKITIVSQPSQLHYKEGERFSLSGMSLFLQYQNGITKVVDDMFSLYHIQTLPENNAILTAKEDKKPFVISGDTVSVTGATLEIEYNKEIENTENVEIKVDTTALSKLIKDCKIILEDTTISDTGKEIALIEWYISEADFHLLETEIIVAEQLLLKSDITQKDVQQQYDKLLLALQNFEQKRILQTTVQPPVLLVSNPEPEYDENVIFSIEKKENTSYYYTLDGSEPNTESAEYTEEVTLFHPEDTNSVTIKVIAVENEISSAVAETTIIYPTVIEHVSFSDLKMPSVGKEVFPISLQDTTECEIEAFYWKEEETEVERFDWETVYSVDILLKANKNYLFKETNLENIPEEIDVMIENVDTDKLHILLTFAATPPKPTQEELKRMALKNLEKLFRLSVPVEASQREDMKYCEKIVSEYAQKEIGEDWIVTFEAKQFSFGTVLSGTLTMTSTIDDSVFISEKLDVTILSDDDKEE